MDVTEKTAALRYLAGESLDVADRGRLVVDVAGISVGIFRLDGTLHAYENVCVHQGGPVCQGLLVPRVRESLDNGRASTGIVFEEDELHIVCPWHGFEYSVRTGAHAGQRNLKLRRIPVWEVDGRIYVTV